MTEQVSIPELESDYLAIYEIMVKILNCGSNRGEINTISGLVSEFKSLRERIESKLSMMSSNPILGHNLIQIMTQIKLLKTKLDKVKMAIDVDVNNTIIEKKENFKNICVISDEFLNNFE